MRHRLTEAVCAVALCVLACLPARADAEPHPLGDDAPAAAVAHYRHGRDLYRTRHFSEAAAEFQAALRLLPLAGPLAYNAARSLERAGRVDEAIRAYERFLATRPGVEEETRVRERMASLTGEARGEPPGPWWLVPLGATVAMVGAATWSALYARGQALEAADAPTEVVRIDKLDAAQGAASTATLLWVAAGAFAAATPLVAWALVTEETAAVSVGWTF